MKISEKTLFVLAISEFSREDGKNTVCGYKKLTSQSFFKMLETAEKKFDAFKRLCERKIQEAGLSDAFEAFKNAIQEVIEHEAENSMLPSDIYEGLCNARKSCVDGIISVFDPDFPSINKYVKDTDRPYLLFYGGNISLLNAVQNNIAVIGVLNPDDSIREREENLVSVHCGKRDEYCERSCRGV